MLLMSLWPSAREHLRDVLIRDHDDRDAIASLLLKSHGCSGIPPHSFLKDDLRRISCLPRSRPTSNPLVASLVQRQDQGNDDDESGQGDRDIHKSLPSVASTEAASGAAVSWAWSTLSSPPIRGQPEKLTVTHTAPWTLTTPYPARR